jgi:hypothetical protein
MTDGIHNNKHPKWQTMWRPFMAWQYGFVCIFDFVIMRCIYAFMNINTPELWEPLTLKSGGLYHLAMLSIITAYTVGRTVEKKTNMEGEKIIEEFKKTLNINKDDK